MNEKIFVTMVKRPRATLKWLFFPVSVLIHGLVIMVVIVAPLLNADAALPELRIYNLSLAALSPPPTPSVPAGAPEGTKDSGATPEPESSKPEPPTVKEFVTPPEIPGDIQDETMRNIAALINRGGGNLVPGAPPGDNEPPIGHIGPSIRSKGSQPGTLRISPVKIPRLIKRIAPRFPDIARRIHLQGVVFIQAVTDIYGRVVKVKVISGHPLLKEAAVKAVKQWIYEPYIINGNPKPVTFTVSIKFKLER